MCHGGVALASLITGCNDESRATFVEPVYPDSCQFVGCAGHGQCIEGDDGNPSCHCDPGYAGAGCGRCDLGFHLDGRRLCVPDLSCADQEKDPCGDHGVCDDEAGVIRCRCDPGYEGARCDLCSSGHQRNDHGECWQALVLIDGGVAPARERCADTSCRGHGQCSDATGTITCECFPGYQGARCDACSDGFVLRGERCVVAAGCDAGACGSCERFDENARFPQRPDNCIAKREFELAELRVSSLDGAGAVWVCGPSSIYGLPSEHLVVEAGTKLAAELAFKTPIVSLRFDYGARSVGPGLKMRIELSGGDKKLAPLDTERGGHGSSSFTFDPPVSSILLRSLGITTEDIALDNIVYDMAMCK